MIGLPLALRSFSSTQSCLPLTVERTHEKDEVSPISRSDLLTAHRPISRTDNSEPADPVVGCPIVRLLFAEELTGGIFQFQPIGDAFGVGEGVSFDSPKRTNSDARSEPPAKKDLVDEVLSCGGFPVVVGREAPEINLR